MDNFVKLAVDAVRGTGNQRNFEANDIKDTLYNELMKITGGKTSFDYRDIRDGKCNGLFTVIEEIIRITENDGLTGNEFFMNLVEQRNIAEGDLNKFIVEKDDTFIVSAIADGTQGLRRQRMAGATEVTVPTRLYGVKVYEEMNRILSRRVEFTDYIKGANKAMLNKKYEACYNAFANIGTDQLGSDVVNATGTYAEATLADLIYKVELYTGKTATIYGTKKACSNITLDSVASSSEAARNDKYNGIYFGSFHGTPVVGFSNVLKAGTKTAVMKDNEIYVIAGDSRPIKFVTEGSPLIIANPYTVNADLTQDYLLTEKFGVGVVITDVFGKYKLAA